MECLHDHRQGTVPKGLQLERKFNSVKVDGYNTATKSQTEDILSKAEGKIHKIMLDHHRKLTEVINRKLEAVEEKIQGIMHHPPLTPTSRDPALIKEIVEEVVSHLRSQTSAISNRYPSLLSTHLLIVTLVLIHHVVMRAPLPQL